MVSIQEKMHQYTKTLIFIVKCLKVVATCCLKWGFFMVPSIVVLGTQI